MVHKNGHVAPLWARPCLAQLPLKQVWLAQPAVSANKHTPQAQGRRFRMRGTTSGVCAHGLKAMLSGAVPSIARAYPVPMRGGGPGSSSGSGFAVAAGTIGSNADLPIFPKVARAQWQYNLMI